MKGVKTLKYLVIWTAGIMFSIFLGVYLGGDINQSDVNRYAAYNFAMTLCYALSDFRKDKNK